MSQSSSDNDRITLTPISRPDPAARGSRSRRRKVIGGAAVVLVIAGGITWGVVAANSGGGKPVKHTAVLPHAFGAYTEAKPGDTEWKAYANPNTDIRKGSVNLTYRTAGGKAAMITMEMDPTITQEPGGSDDALSQLTGTDTNTGAVTSHPAGRIGGSIKCADIDVGQNGAGFTQCVWQDSSAAVVYVPSLNHHTVVDKSAPTDLREFLDALKITSK